MLFYLKNYKFSDSRYSPFLMGISAFCLMLFGLLPCEVILIPAIIAAPNRWKQFILAAAIGSAVGAGVLASITLYFGLPVIHSIFPSLELSAAWALTLDWISHYGGIALIAIAILPIAQTPAIAVAGLFQVSFTTVLFSFLLGKIIKYSIVATLTMKTKLRFNKTKFFSKKRRSKT